MKGGSRSVDPTRGRTPGAPARPAGELAAALRRELRGDVRADPLHAPPVRDRREHVRASSRCWSRSRASADDVAAAIAVAARFDVPVVSRGGGTSLAGQTAGGRGIVLDTSRHLDAIRDLDPEARRVRVEPGVVQEDLNRAAHRHGLGFGPDTSTSNRATIGGMIGNNSSGSQSIVHGTTIDHVLELEVVLADGSRATFDAVGEAERERRARADTLEGAIHRGAAGDPRATTRARSPRTTRSTGASRAATGSTGSRPPTRSTSRSSSPAPRARWSRSPRRRCGWSSCRRRRCSRSATSTRSRARSPPPRTRSSSAPPSIEMIDRTILGAVALEARVPAAGRDARGRPGGAAVRLLLRRLGGRGARQAGRARGGLGARTATATTRCARRSRPSRTR